MNLTTDLHLAAGLAAFTLGFAAGWGRPERLRTRLFALLCAAISIWNLGLAGANAWPDAFPWQGVYTLGVFAAVPLAFHLSLVLTRQLRAWLGRGLVPAYLTAAVLYLLVWYPNPTWQEQRSIVSAIVLLPFLAGTVLALIRIPQIEGARGHRRVSRFLLLGGAAGALAGLSEALPRPPGFPRPGPLLCLVLLLLLCLAVIRDRLFELDRSFIRVVAALFALCLALPLLIPLALHATRSVVPLLLGVGLLIAIFPVFETAVSRGIRWLFGGYGRTPESLTALSRELQKADSEAEVRRLLQEDCSRLPGVEGVFLQLPAGEDLPALTRRLIHHRDVLTRGMLETEVYEDGEAADPETGRALEEMHDAGIHVAVPLSGGERLAGWIGLEGGAAAELLTPGTAAALLAVGNQAVTQLDRIESQRLARQKQALAAVGEMAAGLAHEIRNPLAAVHGAAQVLDSTADSARADEMRQVLREESDRLGRVVGDFLAYARPESGRRDPVDITALTRRSFQAAEAAGMPLRHEILAEADTPAVAGDEDQLHRMMANLIRNAWEATGGNGRALVRLSETPDGLVRIDFEDDGPGIREADRDNVFVPFHTTKSGGTGLGLALVHRIVDTHGGEIRLIATPERGARFRILLPAAE